MIGWLVWGAVYLTRAIEYTVQARWSRRTLFEWLFPLTGFGASKSGIDYRILSITAINAAFVLVATRPAIAVLSIWTARIFAEVVTEGNMP